MLRSFRRCDAHTPAVISADYYVSTLPGGPPPPPGRRAGWWCLTRALLRDARIYIADEATANVDAAADAAIQRTLREGLSGRTVIVIAHRLHTIMDADRILVLDGGEVAEYDTPLALLGMAKREELPPAEPMHKPGTFQALVAGTGADLASVLVGIATRHQQMQLQQQQSSQ